MNGCRLHVEDVEGQRCGDNSEAPPATICGEIPSESGPKENRREADANVTNRLGQSFGDRQDLRRGREGRASMRHDGKQRREGCSGACRVRGLRSGESHWTNERRLAFRTQASNQLVVKIGSETLHDIGVKIELTTNGARRRRIVAE